MLGAIFCLALACAPRSPIPDGVPFQIACNVAEASLWIDDVFVGRVSDWHSGRAIRPGFHRIEIRHPAHHTHYAEIDAKDRQAVRLQAHLHPLLD